MAISLLSSRTGLRRPGCMVKGKGVGTDIGGRGIRKSPGFVLTGVLTLRRSLRNPLKIRGAVREGFEPSKPNGDSVAAGKWLKYKIP